MSSLHSLYNGQNLNFTGNQNPYGLIQNAGKRKELEERGALKEEKLADIDANFSVFKLKNKIYKF